MQIDVVGVVLAAAAIILISFGFNNLNRLGPRAGAPGAPFDLLGLSPAPVMIVLGIVLGPGFPDVDAPAAGGGQDAAAGARRDRLAEERAAVYAMFTVVALEAALNFSVPLYIQIVQGRSPLATAIAMMPFNLSVFFAAMLIVRMSTTSCRRGRSAGSASRSAPSRWSGSPSSCATTGARCRC